MTIRTSSNGNVDINNDLKKELLEKSDNLEKETLNFIKDLEGYFGDNLEVSFYNLKSSFYKWYPIARIDIEKGFMSLRRSISEIPEFNE